MPKPSWFGAGFKMAVYPPLIGRSPRVSVKNSQNHRKKYFLRLYHCVEGHYNGGNDTKAKIVGLVSIVSYLIKMKLDS
jgi:hypothetical protein